MGTEPADTQVYSCALIDFFALYLPQYTWNIRPLRSLNRF